MVLLVSTSCTSNQDDSATTSDSEAISQELIASQKARQLAKNTKSKLQEILSSEGFNDIKDENLIVGSLVDNKFTSASDKLRGVLDLYFKLKGQQVGYDVDFSESEYEYINAENNNGYSMLISTGVCKISGEYVSLGLNITFKKDNNTTVNRDVIIDEGSTLTCTGCRRGCSPRRESNGDGYCTDCQISNSNCTKTETEG